LLQKLVKEISYRTQQCEGAWREGNSLKKFAEFKAFIFSIGSAMDLIRVHVFKDFPAKRKAKYFTDLLDDENTLSQDFKEHLEKSVKDHKLLSRTIKTIDGMRSIFFDKKYKGFCRKGLKEKDFHLWRIYTSLKHTSIVEESYIKAVFTDDIVGTSGDIMIEIFDEEDGRSYELHFPGKPVTPKGVKLGNFGYSSENQTLVWIKSLSQEIIDFLNSLKELLKQIEH